MITIRKIIDTVSRVFKKKMTEICSDFDFAQLSSQLSQELAGNIQVALAHAGAEAYADYISSFDSDTDIIPHEGRILRNKGKVPKTYLTPFGEMTIERFLYQADRGGESFIPLEQLWGMQGQYATTEVRESIAYTVGHCTPDETARILNKCALFKPSATAIKNIVTGVGSLLVGHRDETQQHLLAQEKMPQEAKVIAVSADGVNMLMRQEGSCARRPAERPGLADHEQEAQSCYKNAMVGSISFYSGERDADGSPQRLHSVYVSAMPQENATDFKQLLEREVRHLLADPASESMAKVLLMDGSLGLWNYARKTRLYDGFIPVIDFYHATEHLSKAAEALFGKQNEEAKEWYEKLKGKLLDDPDGAAAVLRSIDYYGRTQRLSATRRKALWAERRFFSRNLRRMDYANLRSQGMPIGSGPVEAACKSIVKNRLCRSGMRWSQEGGEHILNIRTLIKSNRWEKAWECYQEYARAA
jgi:hypothetical protein